MNLFQELLQVARIATDDQGQQVVQIPLRLWEDWTGIDYANPSNELRIIASIDYGGGHFILIQHNQVSAVRVYRGRSGIELVGNLVEYLKTKHSLLIGERTAEATILTIGSALPLEQELTRTVRGRNLVDGLPVEMGISSIEVRDAIGQTVAGIVHDLVLYIQTSLPEAKMAKQIDSIVLRGDFGRVRGLDRRLQEAIGVRVIVR